MIKSEIKLIMDRHCILECEAVQALEFVAELLELQADKIREKEPYAVNTIDRVEQAAREVWDLSEEVGELLA